MRRREFITLLGGAAAWPLRGRAQQPGIPIIGYLHSGSPESNADRLATFRKCLAETGYIEGRNVTIEYRWADGHYDRLPALASSLVAQQVSVIVATGGTASALAAKTATSEIPVVFGVGDDPVRFGLVASLNHPGGNATGMILLTSALAGKRLGTIKQLVPTATKFAALINQHNPRAESDVAELQTAAGALGVELQVLTASTESEIRAAFADVGQRGAGGVLVNTDSFFGSRRDQLVALAAQYRLPAIYYERDFALAGGLMSYGTNLSDVYRQIGLYAARILKGEKPADLPVQQPTLLEFVINRRTANTLGLNIPPTLLAIADEVIE
jgi:putative tryptophan/tyrosine transport system substrate-binding protein